MPNFGMVGRDILPRLERWSETKPGSAFLFQM